MFENLNRGSVHTVAASIKRITLISYVSFIPIDVAPIPIFQAATLLLGMNKVSEPREVTVMGRTQLTTKPVTFQVFFGKIENLNDMTEKYGNTLFFRKFVAVLVKKLKKKENVDKLIGITINFCNFLSYTEIYP